MWSNEYALSCFSECFDVVVSLFLTTWPFVFAVETVFIQNVNAKLILCLHSIVTTQRVIGLLFLARINLETHVCVGDLVYHCVGLWPVVWALSSFYVNQCEPMVTVFWILMVYYSNIWVKIQRIFVKEMHFKMWSSKWQTVCSDIDLLKCTCICISYPYSLQWHHMIAKVSRITRDPTASQG